ncbi:hypothetical protein PLAN_MP30068 [Planktothrix rubescens CCAP 1459/22]|uniref:Uncharacterized protein n=1 Tax=Planktothrix rubescens CCAP 1459/22 TaxID=329571 RepID=A0A6J7ZEH1_PLARU|nr:hypothetical protein PLAN_MP30068 [Planktothrix rubescens NIVA-CYA 18]
MSLSLFDFDGFLRERWRALKSLFVAFICPSYSSLCPGEVHDFSVPSFPFPFPLNAVPY